MSETTNNEVRPAGWLAGLAADWRVQVPLGIAVVVLAGLVGVTVGQRLRRRRARQAEEPPLPEAHPIWDSWRAARAGDVAGYLACFTQPWRGQLEAKVTRGGHGAFEAKLKRDSALALGVHVGPPEELADGALVFPVRIPRQDHVELFDYTVVKEGSDWKIRAVVPRGKRPAEPPLPQRLGPPAEQGGQK